MRNFFLALSFLLYHTVCTGQITGSWIKTRVVFSDNTELPEDMELKYSYARYTFERDGNLYISMKYDSKGTAVKYVTDNNVLTTSLKETGMPLNCYKIEEYNDSSLVLLQSGKNGFDGNDCLRLFLTSEKKYTSSFTATMNEIFSIKGTDTIFVASDRLFPRYKGKGELFDVLKSGMPEQQSADMHFLATYVVDKNGLADSLHIIEGISKDFDRIILKNFNKIRKNWTPALYKGRPVAVLMTQEYRYFSSETMLPVFDFGKKGKDAIHEGDYGKALYYFDLAIKKYPDNVELLYQRAVCRGYLGNNDAACADLEKIKELGSNLGKELQGRFCK